MLWAQQDTVFLNIEQCREMALDLSRALQRSDNAVEQAKLTSKATLTNFFPQAEGFAISGVMRKQEIIDNNIMDLDLLMKGAYMCGLRLTLPLYAGGQIMNGYKLSKVGIEAAEEQRNMAYIQTITDTEKIYWTYVAVLNKVDLLNKYKAQLDTLYEQVATAVAADMAIEYNKLQVETARSTIVYQMKRALNGSEMCRLALSRMVGVNAETTILIPDATIDAEFTPIIEATYDISNRPEAHLLEHQLKASELRVKMTRGKYMPKLGLALGYLSFGNIQVEGSLNMPYLGQISLIDKKFDVTSPTMMIALSVPITKWWEGSYNIKKAKLEVENNTLSLVDNTELMQLEVRNAINNVNDGCELILSAKTALDAATEQLRVVSNRYSANMAPLTDLLDAQGKLHQSESNYLEAITQFMIHKSEYRRVTGQLHQRNTTE